MKPLTQEQIIQGNKIIAHSNFASPEVKFQVRISFDKYKTNEFYSQFCQYHKDWNMLMPVFAQWNKLINDAKDGKIDRTKYEVLTTMLNAVICSYNIALAWEQMIRNIEWYNNLAVNNPALKNIYSTQK